MLRVVRIVVAAACCLWLAGLAAPATAAGPLASGQLLIQGSRLTLYADGVTTDADQTIDVGERARVRTCFGGVDDPCGSVLPGDPRVAGLVVRAELRGPEAPEGLPMETLPGGTFVLPGFQQEGEYRLENIRLVDLASGRVLGAAEPSVALLHVREIVLTSATVRTLSLADLQARGITLSQDDFQAFDFAVGFAFGNETVEIELPIVYNGFDPVQPLQPPHVMLDGLPDDVVRMVKRWQPPRIVPFVLEQEPRETVKLREEEDQSLSFPLFGAIVMPGSVSYLNQFFEARLIVANGAPQGTDVELADLGAEIRLPSGTVLRVVQSDPSVAAGQRVPVVQADGSRILDPGEQGSAAWTIEGLAAGTHTLAIDVTGQIERPGRDPLPVLSRTQAAVEVVDARFNLTFSHPDVVREGEAYSLYVTVTNLSRATQNLITVDLDEQHLTGVHPDDPNDALRRTIETLAPGQAETVEYRMVAELDGKVVATTFQSSSSAGQGTIQLRTGVGELGIPLSPASLVLPRFSDRLDEPYVPTGDFLRANVRFLGLTYSLAVAPAAQIPADLPRVIRSDVERRAIDLGQAGHRTFIGEQLLESLEVLALDQLGNREPLAEIDELRRLLSKGEAAGAEMAALLRHEQSARNLSATGLLDHWATTASYTDPWLAAELVPVGSGSAPRLAIRRPTAEGEGELSGIAGGGASVRTLPYGEVYGVDEIPGGRDRVPLAVIGHVERSEVFDLALENDGTSTASGRLVVILPDDADPRSFRRLDLGQVDVAPGGSVHFSVGAAEPPPSGASERRVDRPPFRVIGAAQDFRLNESGPDLLGNIYRPNRYGNGIVYLFNRPPDETVLDPASFRIDSHFDGLDTGGDPATLDTELVGTAAFVQDDPRVVAVRYSQGVSPLIDPSTGGPLVQHHHALDLAAIVDTWGEQLDPDVPAPRLETSPLHVGALVDGRVIRGTGEPAAGAEVELIRIWRKETQFGTKDVLEIAGRQTTGPDGRFAFGFIGSPNWDHKVKEGYLLRAKVPEGSDPDLEPADVQEIGSRIRLQNRLAHVNIALLGRGVITGELVYQDTGEAVPDSSVTATSTLFGEALSVTTEEDGSFRIGGAPVGPVTLTGKDKDGRHAYATIGIEEPGDTVQVRLEIPRAPPELGTVTGRVVRLSSGDPVDGAQVQVYSNGHPVDYTLTDAFGRFRFDDVPAGLVTLQAASWEISRSSVVSSLTLAAGESPDVTLQLSDGATRVVTGLVVFHDPITNSDLPVEGAVAFISGPGVFAYSDATGRYRIEGVPVQGTEDHPYSVTVIDYARGLQGQVALPPILDVTADVVEAQRVVLESMKGGIDGVVEDPLGRPLGGVEVVLRDEGRSITSLPDGSFSFDDVGVGGHTVLAHVDDGLQVGRVGYFAGTTTDVVYGGHRPFVTLRMVGSGVVTVHTTTASSTGILTPIYYKPTWFHDGSWRIKLKGSYIETTTDPNGDLELTLPVGAYQIVAYNPFHGIQTIDGAIDFAGQTKHHEVVFQDAATVTGQVVDVDGRTPVPDIPVTLAAKGLLPQTQQADAQGRFRFELVPQGQVVVTAEGPVGTVERIGRTIGSVHLGGQELELTVQMKAQGTVRGRVLQQLNGVLQPLAFAQYYLRESSFPYRRLPEAGTFFLTDADGRYQVSHVYAGGVTVVARDSDQVRRSGSARGTITADWEVLDLPDIVMSTSIGSLEVLVRDPETGGPVADAQVRLSNGEWTVSGADGKVYFDALALGTYSVYAFHAPTGRSGRLGGLAVLTPGEHVSGTVSLDQRGEVRGTLYDDASRTVGVAGGTVQLNGKTAGGRVTALATTSGTAGEEGRFSFLGIPEGTFNLEAAVQTSARRARAEATLTDTSPVADVVMVLEPVGDVWVQLFEKLTAGISPVDVTSGLFSTRITQSGYDFTSSVPDASTGLFYFPDLLVERSANLSAQEVSGEQRAAGVYFHDLVSPAPIDGDGTMASPYQLVLKPKGAVRVSVVDGAGAPVAGADVTLNASGQRFPSVTGAGGTVSFAGVPAGSLTASASSPATGTGGTARGTLTYDDEVVELAVQLAPAVAAHGVVYLPVPDDRYTGDPSTLVPAPGIIVQIQDSQGDVQTVLTDADGAYRFDVLPTGGYHLSARDNNGDQQAGATGNLVGPDGYDNPLPALLLDAAPPRIVSIVPPPGLEGVSRTAPVEIVFSEPLLSNVLPTGQSSSTYFHLTAADGTAAVGAWTSAIDAQGYQVVRFTPSTPYENFTTYTLDVRGGPGGVRDRIGRPLTTSGDVGSNFKTSDGVGPEVIATTPSLDRPVDPTQPIRFDFNEAVQGPDEAFDGDGVGDAVVLEGQGATGEWVALPVTLYLTRSGYSVQVEIVEGVTLQDDTLHRRITVSGLTDVYGNPMPVYQRTFRLYDAHPPVVDAVPFPANAPDGELVQGVDYLLVPALSAIDDVTAEAPGGDLDRVDYYFADPTDPSHPVDPSYSATTYPFAFPFVGAYSGDGVTPRPFPVWVRAVDTSTNQSNVVEVQMEVLPNTPPTVGAVSFEALAPVAGTLYAGSSVRATVTGLDDLDGSQLTLSAELRADGVAAPLADSPDRLLLRPASGNWADLAPETFDFDLPPDLAEGTPVYVLARVTDSQGAQGTLESARQPVADDATPATVDGFVAKLVDGNPETVFFLGESFYFELRATDAETAVDTVEVTVDRTDLFPEPLTVTAVDGMPGLYRTSSLTVPVDLVTAEMPVVATARVHDLGGNLTEQPLSFSVAPEADPTAPTAAWIVPWTAAPWPADYTSVVSAGGAGLLLRAAASDLTEDASGSLLPGDIVSVRFRGPVRNPDTGAIELAADWIAGELVAGTGGPGQGDYQALWQVPNGVPAGTELPFEVEVIDGGGTATVEEVRMAAVATRRVYEGVVTAVDPADPMVAAGGDPAGAVFLLDGTTLSLRPQEDGTVRSLGALHLYTGGSIDAGVLTVQPSALTAPEVTTYDSAVLFHPLELAVERALSVGTGSRIDVSGRGLLGATPTKALVLRGETGSAPRAGGSHGGRGGYGSPAGGWDRTDLNEPGTVYDSLRDPHLPGGGGTSANESSVGGAGGGVARILAGTASVRLDGDLRADGGDATGGGGGAGGAIRLAAGSLEGSGTISAAGGTGYDGQHTGGGGGGRISLTVGTFDGGFDPATQVTAAGGLNDRRGLASAARRGGAGTVFVGVLDPADPNASPTGDLAGSGPAVGRVVVGDPGGLPAAVTPLPALGDGAVAAVDGTAATVTLDTARVRGDLTGDTLVLQAADGTDLGAFPIVTQERLADASAPDGFRVRLGVRDDGGLLGGAAAEIAAGGTVRFHGRSRLETVAASGLARLVADDDLLLGAAGDPAPALNDRGRIALTGAARALLRGEGPGVSVTATPEPGTEILLGSSIELSWEVSDPLGLTATGTTWSVDGSTSSVDSFDEPLSVAGGPVTLSVPVDATPGDVTYTVEGTDLGGRTVTHQATWTVLPNEAPAVTAGLAPDVTTPVPAGYPFQVVVQATDREGLAAVSLLVSGPATVATARQEVTGTVAEVVFDVQVDPTADGATPVGLQAVAEDLSAAQTTSDALSIPVAANQAPTASLVLAAGATERVKPGGSTDVTVQASDPDGLATIELQVSGPATEPVQTRAVTGTDATETFTVTAAPDAALTSLSVTAVVTDQLGAAFTTASLDIPIVADPDPPVVTLTLDPDQIQYTAGDVVQVMASATDDTAVDSLSLTIDGATQTSDGTPITTTWTIPPVTGSTVFTLEAEAVDPTGNVGTATRDVPVDALADDVPPTVAFTCPTDGATLPTGYDATLSAHASDDQGIAWVDLFLGDATEPFAHLVPDSGSRLSFDLAVPFTLPATAGTVQLRAEVVDAGNNRTQADLTLDAVDTVDLLADGNGTNDWSALTGQVAVLRAGTLTLDQPIALAGLIVLPGATLTRAASLGPEAVLQVDATGPVYLACGAVIDVSKLGYPAHTTYPGHGLGGGDYGGSHIGQGGIRYNPPAETFGSVYRPQEAGGGGYVGVGGGVVKIVADRVQVDGVIRANGEWKSSGGSGGSIWIRTSSLAGTGSVEALGNRANYSSYGEGGGGAIAIEYSSVDPETTLLGGLHAGTGTYGVPGGAGSVYTFGPDSTYGDLVVDNHGAAGVTRLPALGAGIAQPGSAGGTLVADRQTPIPAYFVGHWVEVADGATGALKGAARIASISADGLVVTLDSDPGIAEGDAWQGVYRFDNVTTTGGVTLESDDPIRIAGEQVISGGVVTTDRIEAGALRIASGATLTDRPTADPASPQTMTLDVGELIVEAGAAIDVSKLGYPARTTYPGHGLGGGDYGGSHIGQGGIRYNPPAETFGSVYRPQEAGGGGYVGVGGGVVKIVADRVQVDGVIRANGEWKSSGGSGGSIWIRTSSLAGTGSVEALGNRANYSSYGEGGGGAVAIEYSSVEPGTTVLDALSATTGSYGSPGGAGSVYTHGPGATYGDLLVDNHGINGVTVLPALGAGVAQAGTAGASLVTDRAAVIPAYFVGHWVEIYDGATTAPKGSARILSIGADGLTVTLDADLQIAPGDLWQGVYRFDNVTTTGGVTLESDDPIRIAGEQVISGGVVTTDRIEAGALRIASGATLTDRPTTDPATPQTLTLDVGELIVEAGGAIDVSTLGYPAGTSYPDHGLAGGDSGGSHVGQGGIRHAPAAETFGSVYRPQEAGGGGNTGAGGGVVTIDADRVQVDGLIRADGQWKSSGGSGGSVWIRTSSLGGTGSVEALGNRANYSNYGRGGGGAIAIEYSSLEPGTTLLDALSATTGSYGVPGGAGSVYTRGPGATYGDLLVDNHGINGVTVLPSLGAGVAQAGTAGATLVTDRAQPIPAYFVGHWVEAYDAATGMLKGTARIASVALDGVTVTLDGDLGLAEGDLWQGVYRFDNVTATGGVTLESEDPIRVAGQELISAGVVTIDRVDAETLRIAGDGTLRDSPTTDPASPQVLPITVSELIVEAGGAIDVSSLGYPGGTSYPDHGLAGGDSGGSHIGQGGVRNAPAAETFGSVCRPQEAGGGGYTGAGGGVVTIDADRVQVDGVIRADGEWKSSGGSGGSVWIRTSSLAGTGSVEALGNRANYSNYGRGGGGAIAVEYSSLEPGTTLLDALSATTGTYGVPGGAGSVYTFGPGSTYGDLLVDNGGVSGITDLPSLGTGTAQAGSVGATVVTDRTTPVPAYFVGHWVQVETPARLVKGTWRIGSADGASFTLVPNGTETIAVDEGDTWSGLFRFDTVTVSGGATLQSVDPVIELATGAISAASAWGNADAPLWNPDGIALSARPEEGADQLAYQIDVAPSALSDADGIAEVRLGDGDRWLAQAWVPGTGVQFTWRGREGTVLSLVAIDGHGLVRAATTLRLALPPIDSLPLASSAPFDAAEPQ